MNAQQQAETQTALRVQGFCEEIAPQFTNTPPKRGDAKFNEAAAELKTITAAITGKHALQTGGGFAEASTEQKADRLDLRDLIDTVNETIAAVAGKRGTPSLMDRFRKPHGNNDSELAARGDAFAAALTELNLAEEIHEHGYEGDIVADLIAAAKALRLSESEQGNALGGQVGATKTLPDLLSKARSLRKTLNAIVTNRFRGDAEIQGRWATANHVIATRSSKKDAPEPAPAPTPPPADK